MTAAPCLPSLKKEPPSVCTSGGVSHANGAPMATARHAVAWPVKSERMPSKPCVTKMTRTKEWLKYKDKCGGETTTSNRNTSKKEKKGKGKAAGMQSRVSKMKTR